jgi:hypothetical protein
MERTPDRQLPGVEWEIYRASALGLLSDPAARRFRPWPSRTRHALFYSPYQLLSVRSLPLVLSKMTGRREGNRITWDLEPVDPQLRLSFEHLRRLAIVLERLSPRYLSSLTRVLHSPDASMWDLVNDHDPCSESEFLDELDADRLERQAEVLLSNARSFDPLGEWHRVVRIGRPSRWTALKGDALLAHEQRIAAELILHFLEDQAIQGRHRAREPVSTVWREPRHDRLIVEPRERAETVMDFELSDRPALVLAVEGPTEVLIATRLLALVGHEHQSTWVSVVDLGGVDGDVRLLARSVAVPRLDPEGLGGARIVAPLTALMVAADPEGRNFGSTEARERILREMKESIVQSLPATLRVEPLRRDLDYLIHLRTWDHEFEFAHFSDRELASAIRKVVGKSAPRHADLMGALADARSTRKPIKRVWQTWQVRPNKLELASALWDILERHVTRPTSQRSIPIADIVEDALRKAQEVRIARVMHMTEPAP